MWPSPVPNMPHRMAGMKSYEMLNTDTILLQILCTRCCETDTTFTDLFSCSFCVITPSVRRVDHVFQVCAKVLSSKSWHLTENFLCALGLTSPSRWVGHIYLKKCVCEGKRENYTATRNFAQLLTQVLFLCTDMSCFSSILKYKLFLGFVGI